MMNDCSILDKILRSKEINCAARKKSFSNPQWPFDSPNTCTVAALVDAGFFCRGEGEVQCWICMIVLDGWESNDVPLQEHKKHSDMCTISNLKDRNDPTIEEILDISVSRLEKHVLKIIKPSLNYRYEKMIKAEEDDIFRTIKLIQKKLRK